MISRNCPICDVPLAPEAYEGFPVLRCPACAGHLLDLSRYEAIRRLPEKSLAELEAEAKETFASDNPAAIRCPRCHLAMEKRPLVVPGFELHRDLCRPCSLVWLDGGELALAQLAYQATPAFRDRRELKRRAAELDTDPERKAAFEEAVAKLPLTADPFKDGVHEGIQDAFFQIIAHPMRIRIR
jgi:Zn-finger nucleic acid-binding protein